MQPEQPNEPVRYNAESLRAQEEVAARALMTPCSMLRELHRLIDLLPKDGASEGSTNVLGTTTIEKVDPETATPGDVLRSLEYLGLRVGLLGHEVESVNRELDCKNTLGTAQFSRVPSDPFAGARLNAAAAIIGSHTEIVKLQSEGPVRRWFKENKDAVIFAIPVAPCLFGQCILAFSYFPNLSESVLGGILLGEAALITWGAIFGFKLAKMSYLAVIAANKARHAETKKHEFSGKHINKEL